MKVKFNLKTDAGGKANVHLSGKAHLVIKSRKPDLISPKNIEIDQPKFIRDIPELDKVANRIYGLELEATYLRGDIGLELKSRFKLKETSAGAIAEIVFPYEVDEPVTLPKDGEDIALCDIFGAVKLANNYQSANAPFSNLFVRVFARAPGTKTKLFDSPVDGRGEFSGRVATSGHRALQAKLLRKGSPKILATSDIESCNHQSVKFDLTLEKPKRVGTLFNKLSKTFGEISEPFPENEEERQLWYSLTDESPADVRRYFNAQALAEKTSDEADGEVWNFYQDYQNALAQGTRERELADKLYPMGTLAASNAQFKEVIFGLLKEQPTISSSMVLLGSSRKVLAARVTAAVKAKDIANVSAQDKTIILDGLVAIRDGLHLSYSDRAHSMGPVILLGDPKLGSVSILFDYFLDGKPLIDAENKNKAILKLITVKEHARLIAAKNLISAVEEHPLMAGWFLAKQLSDRPRKPLLPGRGRALDPVKLRRAASSYTVKQWANLAKSSGVPAHHKTEDDPEQSYANHIMLGLDVADSRTQVLNQLATDKSESFKGVKQVLIRHPEFDPTQQAVDEYFKSRRINTKQREAIKTFARVSRLVPQSRQSVKYAGMIADAGYRSARDILTRGKIEFTENMANKLPADLISKTYCNARMITDMVGELQVQLAQGGAVAKDRFIAIAGASSNTSEPANLDLVPISQMFGPLNTCACTACQSVHSPAAYLYNLLHWMKSDVQGAYLRLMDKRPDIVDVKLSCDNTHTVLPYIDLVNETLCWTLDDTAVPPTETSWEEADLRLQPEHRLSNAEDFLKTKFFPASLPYFRSASEGRAALNAAGISLAEIMATFLPADRDDWLPPQVKAYRRALLDMDVELYDKVTEGAVPSNYWTDYSGFTSAPQNNVGKIMQALGLDFEQTFDLVRLDFVAKKANWNNAFIVDGVDYHDTDCRYEKAIFLNGQSASTNFTPSVAWRAWRLIRLAKVLGMSTSDLNNLIVRYQMAVGGNLEIDEKFIAFLAGSHELEKIADVSRSASLSYLELGHANGTVERLETFASLYTMRNANHIKLASEYLGMNWVDLTKTEDMSALLTRLKPMLESVQDPAKLLSYPFKGESGTRQTLLSGFTQRIYDLIDAATLSIGDIEAVHSEIFEALSTGLSLPANLAADVYTKRSDDWINLYNDASNIPSNVTNVIGLNDYAQALWREWHFSWMMNALTVCNASDAMSDEALGYFGIPGDDTPPDYFNLPSDLAKNIWTLNALVSKYNVSELELFGTLIRDASSSIPPWLIQAATAIDGHSISITKKSEFMEKVLRLNQQSENSGSTSDELSDLFAIAAAPAWQTPATDSLSENLAAQLFKSSASIGNSESFKNAADRIRKDFRDALLDAVIAENAEFSSLEDVYECLLLDPGMQPCMMTSRLKLATNSVQLLMLRGMLNLETGIEPDEDDQQQWTWRKNYRVWEANMKVLLYPENWIDPSLRTNPTPIFEQSIALLAQDEVNDETSEAVIYDYLSGLDKIARLDIRAFYRDEEGGILHVFGRNWVAPYEHYYRRREDGVWTHWEKVDIDIEADHIIPVIFHRRLWLFWPIFIEKQTKETEENYREIKLAYTTYEYGKWRGKKLLGKSVEAWKFCGRDAVKNSGVSISDASDSVGLEPDDFLFIADKSDDGSELRIMVRRVFDGHSDDGHIGYTEMGFEDGWVIEGCNNDGEIVKAGYASPLGWQDNVVSRPFMTLPQGQNMVRGYDGYDDRGGAGLYVKLMKGHIGQSVPILDRAPKAYSLTYPQKKHALWDEPFFMMDTQHTHFYERKSKCVATNLGMYTTPPIDLIAHREVVEDAYEVSLHEQPYACLLIARFNQYGVDGVYARNDKSNDLRRQFKVDQKYFGNGSSALYKPWPYERVKGPWPKLEFDFDIGSAYATYNWELFFHLPTMIARQLKSNGRHEEAIRWLSLIYDPTTRENLGPRRMWKIKPFYMTDSRTDIAALIRLLAQTPSTSQQRKLRDSFEAQLKVWRESPFEPHRIAEHRLSAYMMWAVLEYVDILIDWGDKLFKQDSMESINEGTNLYMMANEILGKKPETILSGKASSVESFASLSAQLTRTDSDWVNDLEGWMAAPTPENGCKPLSCGASAYGALSPKNYFCIPPNPKLPEFWDRVADRLFKIRHCLNFSGEERALALFQPPIDPAMLVRARASGLSIADAIASVSDKGMGYRFQFLLQKAQDFTAEVKALGGQLLSAVEKQNAEDLSLIRQTHELNIQKATRNLKKMSIAEAKESLKALRHSHEGAQVSYDYYTSREFRNSHELTSKNLTYAADGFMLAEQALMTTAGILNMIPDTYAGVPPLIKVIGGDKLSNQLKAVATGAGIGGSLSRSESGRASTYGSFRRRRDDWGNQAETTAKRLQELDRQIVAAEIRLQTAEKDLEIFESQITQSEEIYDFMKSKFSNEQLYSWMVGELKTLHYRVFELAANMARQAQKAANRELRSSDPLSFISANHWDSGRAGLLAGERLSVELKELDNAYWKASDKQTVYELSRTVSLRRLDSAKLFSLKDGVTKSVEINLPKWLFQSVHNGNGLTDMRLQSVAISIPSTTGPNTKVDLKLRLDSAMGPSNRSIITSTAQSDAGRFDPNPGGSKYLPFENESVESDWTLELPERLEFDPSTISDVIFHVRYTAVSDMSSTTSAPKAEGNYAVSLRHDFYNRWLDLAGGITLPDFSLNFPDTATQDFMSRTPYIYANSAHSYSGDYYAILKDEDGKVTVSTISANDLSVEDGKINKGTLEVTDIIAVISVA